MKKINLTVSNVFFFFILLVGGFLRFYNLNWDQGNFLHPDERLFVNASNLSWPNSWSQFFSVNSPLNPHMFYYGSFSLYLYKIVHDVFFPFISFLLVSRSMSAFFSLVSMLFVYLIGRQLFSKKVGILSAWIFSFCAGSIQYAHFNTTESLLVLLSTMITYFSIQVVQTKRYSNFILLGFLLGIAYATKITGLIYGIIPLFSFIYLFITSKGKKDIFFWLVFFVIEIFIVGFFFAPYQLIDLPTFLSQQSYMQGVTYGTFKPPFVIIYQNTLPYIYQFLYVFPFIFGFISFPISLLGFFLLFGRFLKTKNYLLLFLFIFPIFYFLWAGMWFAKFERYYLLIVPWMSVWAGYVLSKIFRPIMVLLLLCIALNGLLYLRVYTSPHTRILASEWMYQHIPYGSTIATEYWDDALPLLLPNAPQKDFINQTLHTYDIDTVNKISLLTTQLYGSDYIVLSSRRVYASILDNSSEYPYTSRLYTLLLHGQLGFTIEKRFTNYPFYFSDDIADETFQSYDHPPVIILKNSHILSAQQMISRIID